MHDRIKELATQAKIQMCSHERLQEFAELIIKDCVDIANEYVRDGGAAPTARSAIGILINKKFDMGEDE